MPVETARPCRRREALRRLPPRESGMLEVTDRHAAYGPVVALRGVSISVPEHGIVAVLGANGAGKSTLMRAISGLVRPTAGKVAFAGQSISHTAAERIVKL